MHNFIFLKKSPLRNMQIRNLKKKKKAYSENKKIHSKLAFCAF